MFDWLEDFTHGMNSFIAAEINHANAQGSDQDPHAHHTGLLDLSHFCVFSPWNIHGSGSGEVQHGHGTHVGETDVNGFTHQTTNYTCAVVSQKMILDRFHVTDVKTGEPLSEDQLKYEAASHGWLSENGTSLINMDRLLEHHGVSCHWGNDWRQMIHDLAAGHQVIIGINAVDLWSREGPLGAIKHLCGESSPNHAIVVKGIHVSAGGEAVVVIHDPGQVNGANVEYPLAHFQLALDTHNFLYVATDHSPPGWSPDDACRSFATHASARPEQSRHCDDDDYAVRLARMSENERHNFMRAL
jgi:hypothetical protein